MNHNKTFQPGEKYSGEVFFGGCGNVNTLSITVLDRTDTHLNVQLLGENRQLEIKNIENWGEYVTVGEDRFFAYAQGTYR